VREWRRGTQLAKAKTVYEGRPDDMSVGAYRDLTPGFERDFVQWQITFWTNEVFLRRDDRLVKIEKPDDANAAVHREWLLVELRSDWQAGGKSFKAGSLLAADVERFLAGDRTLHVLFEPTERTSLAGFSTTKNHVVIPTLDNVRNRLHTLTFRDGHWRREPLPGVPEIGTGSAIPVDDIETDDFFLVTSSSLEPSTLALGTVGARLRRSSSRRRRSLKTLSPWPRI
jgi:prolyl oligopeptidase